jgi:hypothetical protein
MPTEALSGKKVVLPNGKDFEIPADWLQRLVAHHVEIRLLENEQVVEIEHTRKIQTYYPEDFDKYQKNRFFEDCSWRVNVLHDPRPDSPYNKNIDTK